MARNIATLLLFFAYGSCMEMRETVERVVMVRTTGSDLQPAATGYIYKKKSDGPASVVKMEEREILEHLSKLYDKPKPYKAVPDASRSNVDDEEKSASYTAEEHIKPVVEKADEHDDHVDGIAAEDYDKIFEDYSKRYGVGYNNDFADYLHGLGHFGHGIYHDNGKGDDHGSKGYHAFGDNGHKGHGTKHHFEKGTAGEYHSEKHAGYSTSKKRGLNKKYDDDDAHGKHYADGHGYKGDDHGYDAGNTKGEAFDGYRTVFDKIEYKKDHDFFDGDGIKGGHGKYADGQANHESEAGGHKKGVSHDTGHHEVLFGKGESVDRQSGDQHDAANSSQEGGEAHHEHGAKFGAKDQEYAGKQYGYQVKH